MKNFLKPRACPHLSANFSWGLFSSFCLVLNFVFLNSLANANSSEHSQAKLPPASAPSDETSLPKTVVTPRVIDFFGKPEFQHGRDEKYSLVQKNLRLVERALIKTSQGATVHLEVRHGLEVLLSENTELSLPGIQWEDGHVPQVELKSGVIQWSIGDDCETLLISDLFFLRPCKGRFVFTFEPQIPRVQVMVYEGEIEFSASHAEQKVLLKVGEKAEFRGVLENGQIAMDILLHEKKIPRGQLSKIEKMTLEELTRFDHLIKKKKDELLKQAKLKQQVRKVELVEGQICKKPAARLNECFWGKEASKCVRKRCNANGVWADSTDLSGSQAISKCKTKPVVGPCDY